MKTQRGLSTVVGAVFAIIAITTTIAYVSYSTNLLNQYNNTVFAKNQALADSNKEKFQVASVAITKSKLNITLANMGSLPINFTKIWIQNTTTTDWIHSYNPTNNFVSPGATLTNLGQNIPAYINPANSYNVKLVTSRGTSQAFAVNSASAAPINIQLFALPASVNTGFKSELMMIVTNNGSSILTNIAPTILPAPTGLATCTANSVSPASYNILLPGSTAVFKWDVAVSGTNGQTCTYTLNQPLQNGYTQTVQATITVNVITFTQTNLATNTGILTLNYSTFRYAQDNTGWKTGWSFPGVSTSFSVDVTNNNSTGDFYISSASQFAFQQNVGGQDNRPFFIVNQTSFSPFQVVKFDCTGHVFCIIIPAGKTVTINFAATQKEGTSISSLSSSSQYYNMMLIYGKFATSRGASGTNYAQTIPFIAVQTT